MIKAAVLGTPITHSLSPFLHNRAYEILGIDGDYTRIELDFPNFPNFLSGAMREEWTGFSLTMPLKEASFLPELDISLDPRAQKISSVNTLIKFGKSFRGISTDVLAFDRFLSSLTFSNVAIIGAGGTARAALGALDGMVEHVNILRRTTSRDGALEKCVDSTSLRFRPMNSVLSQFDLVISTTPAGVTDSLAHAMTAANGTLIEVLYNPWPTQLSAKWISLGGSVKHGLDLLVEQALDQIQLMTGASFDYATMRATLLEEVLAKQSDTRNI